MDSLAIRLHALCCLTFSCSGMVYLHTPTSRWGIKRENEGIYRGREMKSPKMKKCATPQKILDMMLYNGI
uniref:Putative secreted protein n=1 Tax=Anopheles marajoara TaxID=58244 RepID=A0A2M4CEI6_9DIPT